MKTLRKDHAVERLDPVKEDTFIAEKHLHLERYNYAANLLKGIKSNKMDCLDIACGAGYGSAILRKSHKRVLGIDIDREVIIQNKKRYQDVEFETGSITEIPLADSSIGFITCFETIEHLSKNDGQIAAKELFRVAKDNSTCLVSSPNRFWMKFIHLIKPNPFHIHEYYPKELISVFTDAGWKYDCSLGQMPFNPLLYPLINHRIIKPDRYVVPSLRLPTYLSLYFIHQFRRVDRV